jgi:hypothetical protein
MSPEMILCREQVVDLQAPSGKGSQDAAKYPPPAVANLGQVAGPRPRFVNRAVIPRTNFF